MSSQNTEIKSALVGIYEKLSKPSTKEVGYEQYKIIIQAYLQSERQMTYILQQVSDYIAGLSAKEKEVGLKLLPLIFSTFLSSQKSYQLISPILSIIQANITDSNIPILPAISACYGEIVQFSMKNEIDSKEIDKTEQKIYEILQGFCIYNMKQNDKTNKICGSLCLTKLVENCPFVLQANYMEFIWENIIYFIDKKNFNAKYELMNCLISIILGAEELFQPYANVTLYKVLDFLTDHDWLKRKLALNVIYTLILYCKEDIMLLKDHIIDFLKVLKTDKVKEVREVCLLILQIFNEKGPNDKEEKTTTTSIVVKQKRIEFEKEKARGKQRDKEHERKKDKEDNSSHYISVNTSLNNVSLAPKKKNEARFAKINTAGNNNNINNDMNNSRDPTPSNDKRSMTPSRPIKSKQLNSNLSGKNIQELKDNLCERKSRGSNNKKDNLFINEKMVIKRNPNYSIFKSGPNEDFFKQNKQQDIIVLDNKKERSTFKSQDEVNYGTQKQEEIPLNQHNDDADELRILGDKITNEEVSNHKQNEDIEENGTKNTNFNKIDNKNQMINTINTKTKYRNKPNGRKTEAINEDDMSFKNIKVAQGNNTEKPEYIDQNINTELEEINNNEENRYYQNEPNLSEVLNRNTFPNQIKSPKEKKNLGIITDNQYTNNIPHGNNISHTQGNNNSTRSSKNKPLQQLNNEINDLMKKPLKPSLPQTQAQSNCNDPILLTDLLLQMKDLSEKQIFLIDTLAEMQQETTNQIETMSSKVIQLESSIGNLTTQLFNIKSNNYQSLPQSQSVPEFTSMNHYSQYCQKVDNWDEIQSHLNCNNISQAFTLSLSNNSNLIKIVNQLAISQLREVAPSLLEESIIHLILQLTKGQNITLIISYCKNILMGVRCELRKSTKQSIKDSFLYILNNTSNFPQLTDENIVDINLILSYLKNSN